MRRGLSWPWGALGVIPTGRLGLAGREGIISGLKGLCFTREVGVGLGEGEVSTQAQPHRPTGPHCTRS